MEQGGMEERVRKRGAREEVRKEDEDEKWCAGGVDCRRKLRRQT